MRMMKRLGMLVNMVGATVLGMLLLLVALPLVVVMGLLCLIGVARSHGGIEPMKGGAR